ncbi:hypothetical protein M514_08760 [Trichuris suis]|uniref:BMP-binding endothelial regulator protein n=1 Tax=Trichuris suis TaxID=68888 RepID=A0A085LZI2_9BILA|nr:hypothetical protein M513_08760 [Trichuris suis]KFD65403.1 hypothetical protein M514_08760 [Trichuris suis]KHJ45070.1 von Willebrand factor type D domain protein [Trichuris suis]
MLQAVCLYMLLFAGERLGGAQSVAVLKSYPYACDREGDLLYIKGITSDPCITCICKDGTAHCITKKCPSAQRCPVVVRNQSGSCCKECKNCVYLDVTYKSGEQWMSTQDSCRRLTCKAGVVTSARIQCIVPCSNAKRVVGLCCPVCPQAQNFTANLPSDPCVQCQCNDHWCHCFQTACPVLNCPPSEQYVPDTACCPECRKSREDLSLPMRICFFQNKVYQLEQSFRPDPCTLCLCQETGVLCRRFVCPQIACLKHRLHFTAGLCCPLCRGYDFLPCSYHGSLYRDGQTWKKDSCTKCKCSNGKVHCVRQRCAGDKKCPRDYSSKPVPGQCCSVCVEKEATCLVSNDLHYKTFDGREYNFRGSCRYILAQECLPNSVRPHRPNFLIVVRNEPRNNGTSYWTRHVSIRLQNKIRISLLPAKKVSLNGEKVSLPYVELGVFSVMYDKTSRVLVRLNAGPKVVWDGNGQVEVTVTSQYKGRLCGLCGNYNNNAKDDFFTKSGTLLKSAQRFGRSWRVGSWRACKTEQDRRFHLRRRGKDKQSKRKNSWQKSRLTWILLNDLTDSETVAFHGVAQNQKHMYTKGQLVAGKLPVLKWQQPET